MDFGYDVIDGGDGVDWLQVVVDGVIIGIYIFINVEVIDGNGFVDVIIVLGNGDDYFDLSDVMLIDIVGIVGGKGNDVICGSNGDDIFFVFGIDQGFDDLDGGVGQDWILVGVDGIIIGISWIINIEVIDVGGYVNVCIVVIEGNDILLLQGLMFVGISEIDFGVGDDIFVGLLGNDVIFGDVGNDMLFGGVGDDIYLFGCGDGNDVICEKDVDSVGGGNDIICFGVGVLMFDVQVM